MKPVERRIDRRRSAALGGLAALLLALAWLNIAGRRGDGDSGPIDRAAAHRIAVNTADAAELQLLPGVGESLAAAIIASRRAQGPFTSIDDLRRVNGIGRQLPLRWQPHITFEAPSSTE